MNKPSREKLKRSLIRNEAGEDDYLGFEKRCVHKFGPAAGIFLRQLVYWAGKEHDTEGWIYKTQSEMTDETGLSRRHQEGARKVLRSQGVIREDKRGIPRRLWYWIDFAALVRIMEDPHSTMNQWKRKQDDRDAAQSMNERCDPTRDSITEHTDEIDSTAQASGNGSIHPASDDDSSAPASEDDITYRPITESTSETTAEISTNNHSSENQLLQSCEDHASRGLSQHEDMNLADPLRPSMGELLQRIYYLLDISGSAAYRAYERYLEGTLSLADLASEICFALTGSRDEAESYVEPVRRMVDEFAIDDAGEPPPGGPQNRVP